MTSRSLGAELLASAKTLERNKSNPRLAAKLRSIAQEVEQYEVAAQVAVKLFAKTERAGGLRLPIPGYNDMMWGLCRACGQHGAAEYYGAMATAEDGMRR